MLLVRGYSNKEIAGMLGISERTVEGHVSAVLHALGLPSRIAMILATGAPALLIDRMKPPKPRTKRVPRK